MGAEDKEVNGVLQTVKFCPISFGTFECVSKFVLFILHWNICISVQTHPYLLDTISVQFLFGTNATVCCGTALVLDLSILLVAWYIPSTSLEQYNISLGLTLSLLT